MIKKPIITAGKISFESKIDKQVNFNVIVKKKKDHRGDF